MWCSIRAMFAVFVIERSWYRDVDMVYFYILRDSKM